MDKPAIVQPISKRVPFHPVAVQIHNLLAQRDGLISFCTQVLKSLEDPANLELPLKVLHQDDGKGSTVFRNWMEAFRQLSSDPNVPKE